MLTPRVQQAYLQMLHEYRDKQVVIPKLKVHKEEQPIKHRKQLSHQLPKMNFEVASKNTSPRFRFLLHSPPLTTRDVKQANTIKAHEIKGKTFKNKLPFFAAPVQEKRQQIRITEAFSEQTPSNAQTQFKSFSRILTEKDKEIPTHIRKRSKSELRKLLFAAIKKCLAMNIYPNQIMELKVFSRKPYQKENSQQFIHAVKLNQIQVAQQYLDKNKYLVFDFDYYNMTALHWACKKGYFEMAKFLVEAHCDIDAVDIMNRTPLYISIEGNHHLIVDMLLNNKANPWSTRLTDLGQVLGKNTRILQSLKMTRRVLNIQFRFISQTVGLKLKQNMNFEFIY